MSEQTRPNADAQYIATQRTVEVLQVLKQISDEEHPVTKKEILEQVTTTENPQTLSNTVDEILLQINPVEYTGDNDHEYRIKYDGYDAPFEENALVIKSGIGELRKAMRREGTDRAALQKELDKYPGGKAPAITNIRYIHAFSNEEMDRLISAVVLSASIPSEEKEHLIAKIMDTASMYYKSPFFDKVNRKLRFNPFSEYSRLSSGKGEQAKRLGENVRILQDAIRLCAKVRFHFDVYSADKKYVSDDDEVVVSPYYIVIYHDQYYLIGAWDTGKRACHYRIDLMSSPEILRDEGGLPVPMRPLSQCEDLPGRDQNWDPEKYMSEHLYMDFGKPRRISLKIPSAWRGRYTTLHDWFGDHFELNKAATARCEEGYEVVNIVTSPGMLVHWAMQYADKVEVLDDEVREEIRKRLERMQDKYLR